MEKRKHLNWYKIEDYAIMFTEERWAEIWKAINEYVPAVMQDGRECVGFVMNPPTRRIFNVGTDKVEEINDHTLKYCQACVLTEILTDEEYAMVISYFDSKLSAKREQSLFDSAKKYTEAEYNQDAVWFGDRYYDNIEEFLDDWDADWEDLPKYLTANKDSYPLKNCHLEDMIENHLENGWNISRWDDYDSCRITIPKYLEEAWDKFKEEHKDYTFYEASDNEIVILDRDKHIKERKDED